MQQTANANATDEAKRLLNYLSETAGHRLITGQHTQTNPMEEIAYIREQTGKEPLLRGFEMLAYSPNINYDDATEVCLTEVYENRNTMETALQWAKESGGIVTLSFHWFSPLGGHDKSFYAENTDFDATKVLEEGTPERAAFYHDMDVIATELRKFQEAQIPVLWRPFHELDGEWFWWGAKGPQTASRLYRLMYEYYTDYHEQYEHLIRVTSKNKVAALAEVGYLPDIALLAQSHTPWAYYMTWSKEFCIGEQYNRTEQLREMYDSPYAVTLK